MFYDFSRTLFTLALTMLAAVTVFSFGGFSYSPIFLVLFIISQIFTKNYATVGSFAYIILGILGLQVFAFGGGIHYFGEQGFTYLIALIPFTIFAFIYKSSFEEILADQKKLFKPLIAFGILHLLANVLLIVTGRFNFFRFLDLSLMTALLDVFLAALILVGIQRIRLKVFSQALGSLS